MTHLQGEYEAELRRQHIERRKRLNSAVEPVAVSNVRRIWLRPPPKRVEPLSRIEPKPRGVELVKNARVDKARALELARTLEARAIERARIRRLFVRPIVEIEGGATQTPLDMQVKTIINEVCLKHGISREDIMSVRRDRPTTAARQEACYRLRYETPLSLPRIGRRLGNRDHTTVLHSVRRHEKLLAESWQ